MEKAVQHPAESLWIRWIADLMTDWWLPVRAFIWLKTCDRKTVLENKENIFKCNFKQLTLW